MRTIYQSAAAAFGALLVTACAGAPLATSTADTSAKRIESRAAITQHCLVGKPASPKGAEAAPLGLVAALASALIPKAIDVGLGGLAGAFREAGAAERKPIIEANAATHLYTANIDTGTIATSMSFGCLTVARGQVAAEGRHDRTPWNDEYDSEKRDGLRELLGISGHLEFYYEARIEISGDKNSFRLASSHFEYHRDSNLFSDSRDLVMTATFETPGGAGNTGATPFGIATITFPKVARGTVLDSAALAGHSSRWIPLAAVPAGLTEVSRAILANRQLAADKIRQKAALNAISDADYEAARDKQALLRRHAAWLSPALTKAEDDLDKLSDGATRSPAQLQRAQARAHRMTEATEASFALAEPPKRTRAEAMATLDNEIRALDKEQQNMKAIGTQGAAMVDVMVREVREANDFLLGVARILDESKAGIGDALKAELDPAARRQAEERAAGEAESKASSEHQKLVAVLDADQLVESRTLTLAQTDQATRPSEYLTAYHNLQDAKMAANEARRKAGKPAIYEVDIR